MRIGLVILVQLLLFVNSFAQKEADTWLFGRSGGFNKIVFEDNIAVIDTIQEPINFYRTNGQLCDKDGEVLVFTNGYSIFNGNNEIAINGEGLNPGWWRENRAGPEDYEMPQGAIILPSVSDSSKQIIFHLRGDTLSYDSLSTLANGAAVDLLISETQINSQAVLQVIEKNVSLISDTLTHGISACQHGNGRDWWIIVSESHSNCFYTILLSPDGLEVMPKQCFGAYHGFEEFTYTSFSPNGELFIRGALKAGLEVFNFDRCLGELGLEYSIDAIEFADTTNPEFWQGIHAISSNNNVLYAVSFDKIQQFDLTQSDILSSKILIHERDTPATYAFQGTMLGPDDKIYIAGGLENFHRINNPDQLGLACDFEKEVPTEFRTSWALPNVPNFRMGRLVGSDCDTLYNSITSLEETIDIQICPNPTSNFVRLEYDDFKWSNKSKLSLQISNVLGQSFLNRELPSNSISQDIDVSDYPNGIYIIQLYSNGRFVGKEKLIVNKSN